MAVLVAVLFCWLMVSMACFMVVVGFHGFAWMGARVLLGDQGGGVPFPAAFQKPNRKPQMLVKSSKKQDFLTMAGPKPDFGLHVQVLYGCYLCCYVEH